MKIKTNQKILIGIGILGLLVVAGLVYVSQIGITPTDTKIVKILEENEKMLLSIDGVVSAGIARNEDNSIAGIAVYIEDTVDDQKIPSMFGEFNVVFKKISEVTEFEKERMIICKQVTSSSSFGNDQVEKAITDYLLTQKYFSWKTTTDSRNFCVIENLNPKNDLFPLYVWVRCGEFILQNGKLKELSGKSVPAKIDYPNELSFYDLSKFSYEVPRDGSLCSKDIKTIFPLNVQRRIADFNSANLNKKIESIALSGLRK